MLNPVPKKTYCCWMLKKRANDLPAQLVILRLCRSFLHLTKNNNDNKTHSVPAMQATAGSSSFSLAIFSIIIIKTISFMIAIKLQTGADKSIKYFLVYPRCGHCQRLAPEWAKAATELKGKVKVAALDATVHTVSASRYQIQGYPSIKVFNTGVKNAHSVEDYEGPRSASDIIQFALDKLAESIEPPEVLQIVKSQVLKENCDDKPICIVAVLPHILDTGASGRNQYLKIMKSMGEKYKKKQWGWIWAEAGAQPKLEDALGMGGFGYPAMAAVNVRKMKYATLKGPFDNNGVEEFLRTVSVGRGSTSPVKGAALPSIDDTEPWDGKDGEMPVEEDIDLSDVDMDEDETPKKEEL